jgi:HNH endonuclease
MDVSMIVIRFVFILLFFYVFMFFPSSGGTHSGGLDSNGGHYNHKTGKYHSHEKPSNIHNQSSHRDATEIDKPTPLTQHIDKTSTTIKIKSSDEESVVALIKTTSINDYFRAANENVGALDCNVEIHARDVGEAKKRVVRNRDGNRCAICGSKSKLEVDHMRGLQNGGTNDIFNLALLCDTCHTTKTKYDNSLRRKRESICRKK